MEFFFNKTFLWRGNGLISKQSLDLTKVILLLVM